MKEPFLAKSCALATMATGVRAGSLLEFRDKLGVVETGSVYHHFWGGRLNPQFVHPQYHNDFALWSYYRLHDQVLAERLNIIDPTEFENLEALRQTLLEVVERRLDEAESILWLKSGDRFHFIDSSIIVFDTALKIGSPEEMGEVIAKLPPSSIFYHFIDARRRTLKSIDFYRRNDSGCEKGGTLFPIADDRLSRCLIDCKMQPLGILFLDFRHLAVNEVGSQWYKPKSEYPTRHRFHSVRGFRLPIAEGVEQRKLKEAFTI